MNERKDERWLDEQLRDVIRGSTPAFDAESWKRKYRDQYDALTARTGHSSSVRVRQFRGQWIVGVAAAVAIALTADVWLLNRPANAPTEPPAVASSAEMMSMRSLRLAYEQGGFDELDRQLQNALDEFGPRSSGVSLQELF